MKNNIRTLIDDSPMSSFQILAVVICFIINMLDGFDVLVMAFTAHSVQNEWGLSGKSLGILFSAGLAGMAIGAVFLGRLADRYGRRALVFVCLATISIGMLLSALSENMFQLAILRVFTGIGIGGALATVNIITTEYSSNRRRGLAIAIIQIGYPVGAIIGGAIAAILIPEFGWRSVFFLGGMLSVLMFPVVYYLLPESMDYLLLTRPEDALTRVNSLMRRMGHEALPSLPEQEAREMEVRGSIKSLWGPRYRKATILMWSGFFMVMASLYFVLSWTPKLLIMAGLSESQGISGGMLLQIGGIVGQVIIGFLSARFMVKKLGGIYMFLSALFMCLFAAFSSDLNLAMYLGVCVGFFLFGSIAALYILGPALFPVEIRTTGFGASLGVGRVGAIIAPFVTGVLLDLGWQTSSLFYVFALPMIIAMTAILLINSERGQA